MSFQKLLDDLEAISGSQNDGDDVTKSMAADGDDAGGDGDGDEGGDADDAAIAAAAEDGADAGDDADAGGKGGDEGDALGKSLKILDENGDEQEAIDATDLIKSLVERVDQSDANMGKAVGLLTDLVKAQAAQIGALTGQVGKLAGAGRGRRAIVSVADKPALTKALGEGGDGGDQPEGMPANEFMAKAMEACSAGKITGLEVSRAEAYINRGLDVPASIKTKVLGA